jgi:hypothetical protein
MGGGGPKETTSTNVTKTEPPGYIAPYAIELANRSGQLANRPYTPYPGVQVAPLNAYHQTAMNTGAQRAVAGSPSVRSAQNMVGNTLGGDYLGKGAYSNSIAGVDNPYLNNVVNNSNQDIVKAFQSGVIPQTNANFARSGAFGGSAWQQANSENSRQLVNELAKNTSNIRYQDYMNQQQLAENLANRQTQMYGNERANMLNAAGQSIPLANQDYTDVQNLLGIADISRDYEQTLANQNYQNFLNEQNWPLQNLDILANAIRTSMGGGTTSVSSAALPSVNPTASMIGGGLAGGTLGYALGGNTGGAVGAGLGALASYL